MRTINNTSKLQALSIRRAYDADFNQLMRDIEIRDSALITESELAERELRLTNRLSHTLRLSMATLIILGVALVGAGVGAQGLLLALGVIR